MWTRQSEAFVVDALVGAFDDRIFFLGVSEKEVCEVLDASDASDEHDDEDECLLFPNRWFATTAALRRTFLPDGEASSIALVVFEVSLDVSTT